MKIQSNTFSITAKTKDPSFWGTILREVIPSECTDSRPFVCDGFRNPKDCDIVIIGKEPKTHLGDDWWEFWDDEKGFDFELFETRYNEVRLGKPSKTRKYFNHIKAKGFSCIETNAFSNTTDIRPRTQNIQVVKLLIDEIPKLKGIIAHGEHAKKCLRKLIVPAGLKILEMHHFSARGKTDADIKAKLDRFCESLG